MTNDNAASSPRVEPLDLIKQLNKNQTPATANNLDFMLNMGNNSSVNQSKETTSVGLFDLLGNTSANSLDSKKAAQHNINNSGLDDLFGGLGLNNTNGSANSTYTGSTTKQSGDIMDLFNTASTSNHKAPPSKSSLVVYEKNDLRIVLELAAHGNHSNQEQHFLTLTAQNNGLAKTIREFLFSAAVPKTMQIQLSTPSNTNIQPLDSLVQTIAISNPKKVTAFCLVEADAVFQN